MEFTDIRKLINEIIPKSSDSMLETVNEIKRTGAKEVIKVLKEKHGLDAIDPKKYKELENKNKYLEKENEDLKNRLNITEGCRSHLATELQKLQSKVSEAGENAEKIEHMVNARAQRSIDEYHVFEKYGPWDKAKMSDYIRLVQHERAVTTSLIKSDVMKAQVLTQDAVVRFCKSPSLVIVYSEEGRRMCLRWRDLFTYCFQSDSYDPGMFTHYCIVPNVGLEDLLKPNNDQNNEN